MCEPNTEPVPEPAPADVVDGPAELVDGGKNAVNIEEQMTKEMPMIETPRNFSNEVFKQQSELAVPGNIKLYSGCRDAQTSADVSDVGSFGVVGIDDKPGGAFTHSMLSVMQTWNEKNEEPSLIHYLQDTREKLREFKFRQIPMMSTSRKADLSGEKFSILNAQHTPGTSKTRALLVGINYSGTESELNGCINDVKAVREMLIKNGYDGSPEHMRVLVDDGHHEKPIKKNILEGMKWLHEGAQANDSLFMLYSGHGSYQPDQNGDEQDGQDETLVPADYKLRGMITDDILLKELVLRVPKDCSLVCFFDCCHSGTILDLPYLVSVSSTFDPSRGLEENPGFSFKTILEAGKKLIEESGDTLSGGLANIKEFIEGFRNVVPAM